MRATGLTVTDDPPAPVSSDEGLSVLQMLSFHEVHNPVGWLANVLQYLEAQGFVDCRDKLRNGYSALTQPVYSVSKAGLAYLEQRKELAQKNAAEYAKEKAKEAKDDRLRARDARRSWWQFALGLILGWILGGFTFREFLDWMMGLFR